MPLYSDHIANMYYGASPSYSSLPYGYNSSASSLGSSYSASYLNPGGSYSSHSSLGGYSRAPLTSRWISGVGRNYSPMLSTISERGSASPIRINSPRRIPITTRSYGTPSYTTRPININTADIDVSKDRYRHKEEKTSGSEKSPTEKPQWSETTNTENENGPFMPRVDGKPETGIDSSPGVDRSTIKRGRTVVRLYTIKRKERDSPRKPPEASQATETQSDQDILEKPVDEPKTDKKESMKWREKLSDDLAYKDKKEKKTLGAKLMEKFIVKETSDKDTEISAKVVAKELEPSPSLPTTPIKNINFPTNVSLDRRCSMELLAEQAHLLDSLIRSENLSTASLDLSKVGVVDEPKNNNIDTLDMAKRRRPNDPKNPLKTTKSDHSLHDNLRSYKDVRDTRKRQSIKKSASGGSICRLDSITEFPREPINIELPAIDENRLSIKQEPPKQKLKPKLKTKITSSVEVSAPVSPLKFRVENVIVENAVVEEKLRIPRKGITYSSEVEIISTDIPLDKITENSKEQQKIKKKSKKVTTIDVDPASPEPADGNFWDKIGKRETVYLMKRKENLEEAKEKHKRSLFWFPEEEESDNNELDKIPEVNLFENSNIESDTNAATADTMTKLEFVNADITNPIQTGQNSNNQNAISSDIGSMVETNKSHAQSEEQTLIQQCDAKAKSLVDSEIKQKLTRKETTNDTRMEDVKASIIETDIKTAKPDIIVKKVSHNLSKKSKIEENSSDVIGTSKTANDLSEKENMIGKSASLEIIRKNKVAIPSDKKTKSEKLKNIRIKEENCEKANIKLKQFSLPKSSNNREMAEKSENEQTTPDNKNKKVLPLTKQGSIVKTKSQKDQKDITTEQKVLEKLETNTEQLQNEEITSSHTKENTQQQNVDMPILLVKNKSSKDMKHTLQSKPKENSKELSSHNNKTEDNPQLENKDKVSSQSDFLLSPDKTTNESPNNDKDTNAEAPTEFVIEQNVASKFENIIQSKTEKETKIFDVPEVSTVVKSQDIPIKQTATVTNSIVQDEQKTGENEKAESISNKDKQLEKLDEGTPQIFTPKRPVKEEKALKPLIATPRPLQKRAPQVIHSSDSSSEEESSEEEDDSDSSEDSAEFFECDNNADGRISTGSNDSGFDSSAPTSPATFLQIKKDCDVNCHRKCEKLTANLCGVNQRLLVEALASRTASKKGGDSSGASSSKAAPAQCNNTDIVEQELEQSTAYDLFRKTGRFTPPARSIPRFRKYTIEDFQFIKVLGKGSFGKVLLAELRDTEYYYAVKCLKKDVVLEDDDVECTLIERKVLALGTNHPYLCHLFATFQTDSHLFFVMEYLNGGDLMFHIQQSGRFPEARARFYAAEIVSGLKFLHKRGIVYRDLKLDNILLDFEGHVRIADFGMCKLQIYLEKTADTFCGTPDYMAPEIIKGLKYNQTVDWWSFGVLLYEMLIGQSPFSGCDEDELFWSICNEMPSYPRFLSHEALTILTRLLDKDARTRLGGTECMHGDIREQEFFHPVPWDRLERRDLEAPFRPRVRHPMDTQYFDRAFTGERPRLTAVEPHVLRSMDQEPFRGFSYTNPNTTDR